MGYQTVGPPTSDSLATDHRASSARNPQALGHVVDDLEAIFGRQVLHPLTHPGAAPEPQMPSGPPRSPRQMGTILGAVAVAIVAGALFGFVLDRPASVSRGPQPGPPPKVMENEPPTAVTTPSRVLSQTVRSERASADPVEVQAVRLAPSPQAAPPSPSRVALRPSLPARTSVSVEGDAPVSGCAGRSGYGRAQCGHEALMAADRGLRRAYAHARRAGVSDAELTDYSDQWTDLLNQSKTSPLRVAAEYWALAGELDQLAAAAAETDRDDEPPEL